MISAERLRSLVAKCLPEFCDNRAPMPAVALMLEVRVFKPVLMIRLWTRPNVEWVLKGRVDDQS